MVSVKLDDLKRSQKYYLMTSTIVPRPIAVVGTLNADGSDNLASFSYFNAVSTDPPCIMFSVTHHRDGRKDTLVNVERNKEFVLHIAQADQVKVVDDTGHSHPYGVSEREKLGLTLQPSTWIQTPRVTEFKVALECILEKLIDVGGNTMVIGRIIGAHLDEKILLDGEIRADSTLLDPLARMDRNYGKVTPTG